ncbi:MAG TPA: zinc ribbon domain-containing protein [Terriglobales bacterium]|nr:zinc ribbon domain-containing protein [Terriglobales bacterium]
MLFCNRCGTQLQPDFNLCPKCGAPVANISPAGVPVAGGTTKLERHLRTLGILWIVVGVLWVVPSLVLMGMSHASHIVIGDEMFTRHFMPPLMFSLGSVFLFIAAGGILVGWGLMNHERWARITAIIVGILAIFHPPFGTALGIYTLWVLLSANAAAEYDRMSHA